MTRTNETGSRHHFWNILTILHYSLCLLATICVTSWWIYKYSLQELSTSIDIKHMFKSKDDLQPAFSVCVTDPRLNEKLQTVSNNKYNKTSYIKFLRGIEYHEALRNIDYNLIRFNWSEYFIQPPLAARVSDHGKLLGRVPKSEYWKYSTSFIGLQSSNKYLTDCISFEPLRKEVANIKVKLKLLYL